MRRTLLLISIPLVLIICFIALYFANHQTQTTSPSDAVSFDYSKYPYMGESIAKVKVVEFGDYKCPACQYFNLKYLPEINKNYIQTGKIQWYFVNYPFIAESDRAALFAETVYQELGSETFWKLNELFYQHADPKKEQVKYLTDDYMINLLKPIVNDNSKANHILQVYQAKKYQKNVASELQKGNDSGVSGTPTIFVDGRKISNSMDVNQVKDLIDQELKANE